MKGVLYLLIIVSITGCVSIPGPESPDSGILELYLSTAVFNLSSPDMQAEKPEAGDVTITVYLKNMESGDGVPFVCEGGNGYYLAYNLPAGRYELSKVYATYYYIVKESGQMNMVSSSGIPISRPADKKIRKAAHKLIYRSSSAPYPFVEISANTVFFYGSLEVSLIVDPAAAAEAAVEGTKPIIIASGSLALMNSNTAHFQGALQQVLDLKISDKWKPLRILSRE